MVRHGQDRNLMGYLGFAPLGSSTLKGINMAIKLGSVDSRLPLKAFEGKFPNDGSDTMIISVDDAIELEKAMAWMIIYSKAINKHLKDMSRNKQQIDIGFLVHHNNAISTSIEVQLDYDNWSDLKDAIKSYFDRTS